MQKVLDLLEKHVQWLALGLGVVWLLLMTWTYVLNPPAKVEINNETLTARQVDDFTVRNAVRPLEEAMKPKEPPPMEVANFAERWQDRMAWKGIEPVTIAGLISSPRPIPDEILKRLEIAPTPQGPQGPGGPQQIVVAQALGVPAPLPAPAVSDWRFGRSTILVPPPVVPIGQPQPPAGLPTEADKDWITQSFKVSLPAIAALFKEKNVPPPPIGMTAFLRVELVRQELLPSGQWGSDVTLKPLPPLQPNQIRQPFPAPNAGIHQENAYLNWAVQNTGDIVQPAFYTTVQTKGDMWQRPGEPVLPAGMAGGFNPQQFLEGAIPPELTPEQRKQVLDLRRQMAAQRRLQQQQNRPVRTRPGRGEMAPEMEGEINQAPVDGDRPKFLQVRPAPRGYPQMAPEMEDPAMMEDPLMFEQQQMQPQLLGVGTPDVDYPAGQFDPATWAAPPAGAPGAPPPASVRPQEVSIWAHDDTVQPGKTYRYKARYVMKNPLYQVTAAVKDPKAAKQFAIESEFSAWGPAIEVPPLTNFFIANANLNQGRIRFDVYHWEKGMQHHTQVTVGPGDLLAASANGVTFNANHTVVELRPALRGGDPVVFLANNQTGQPVVRTQSADQRHPVYKKLKEVVAAAQATAAANGGAAGGAVVR